MRALAGASLLVFGLLVALAAPGVTWFDGGELGAAGVTLGIAHPTGFPTWTLLAHVAGLVPVGELAFRVTLLSAALAASAGAVVAWSAWRLTGRWEALTATVVVPFCPLVFPHAVAIEVYAFHAFCVASLLALVVWLSTAGDPRRVVVAALAVGLILGGHGEMRLLVLPALVAVLWMRRDDLTPGALAGAGALCALGLAVHVALPVRAAAGAARDWSRPDTWAALVDHVSAARIRLAFAHRMFRPTIADWSLLARQALPAGVPLLAFALGGLTRVRLPWGASLTALAIMVVDLLYCVLINPMGLVDLQNGAATFVALALLAAALVPRVASPLVLMFPLLAIAAPASDGAPRRYGLDALAQVGPHGLLMTTSDHLSSTTLWLRDAEGARPDVHHLVRQHAWVPAHARGVAALARPGDTPAVLARREAGRRSVRWEHGGGREEAALVDVLDAGVPTFAVGGDAGEIPEPDRYGAKVAASHLNRLGVHALFGGDVEHGRQLFQAAGRRDPTSVHAYQNLGTVASMQGHMKQAVELTRRALDLAPDSVEAWVNLGRYELVRQRDEPAGHAFERALELDPTRASAWAGLGAVEANRGRRRRAAEHLLKALEIDPGLEEARINLAKLRGAAPD